MFRTFADVQTAEMLNLPRPALETGKPIVVACPMSDEQARPPAASWWNATNGCDRRRSIRGRTTPSPSPPTAASSPSTPGCCRQRHRDFPGSKINALVENVARHLERTAATRGTQMMFCDMGVQSDALGLFGSTTRSSTSWSPRGIPREQIAAIGDADSDAKKQALFDKVRSGQVRVLIGSTQKMGTGTNVQKRLVASASPRRSVETGRGRAARGPHSPPGQRERGSGDLSLCHRRIVRRLYVGAT